MLQRKEIQTMAKYITSYIIPVLIVMIILLIVTKNARKGINFKSAVLICFGFLLGWASAFISIYIFFFHK
jgi:hypothetical protein